jgi:oxygen-independent coproporphyrinogen-3 oxidase
MTSVYVHIPFCAKKCRYCDFYSIEAPGKVEAFLAALDQEVGLLRADAADAKVETIFLGGGTPSLLPPAQIQAILERLRSSFNVTPDAETTLEANPGTLTRDSLAAYRAAGVSRLSLGVQSFHDPELKALGRIHSAEDACRAVEDARAAGFHNLGLDLIYALPGQSLARWETTLRTVIRLAPEHVSAYALTIARHTPFGRMLRAGELQPAPTDTEAAMFERTMEMLEAEGYEHYEVSNYARPGFRCRHNLAYWTHRDYLGLGPSAHSFRMDEGGKSGRRWWNLSDLSAYLAAVRDGRVPVGGEERLGVQELTAERIFLGLRDGGLHPPRLARDLGYDLSGERGAVLRSLQQDGLAGMQAGVLRLTRKGYLVCDEIARRLLPR